ncbi:MAG: DEAD/DEAH box helicase, partial [Clostridia bacterium]|nr:DEAD/DEAH box helicase [Clostridia bacterium]
NYGFKAKDINPKLFDWQRAVVDWACKKGRAALFEDCGLGKTAQQLEFGRQVCNYTGGRVLILAPLAVAKQTAQEGKKFDVKVNICRSQKDVVQGINITNYEMLEYFNPDTFDGVILDESSILKSYMGKYKRELTAAFRNTPYKLSCTATPSPNNHLEILNQAEFLGIMKSNEALSVWFINDGKQAGNYRLKKHAVKGFWEWVSTWAICMSKPSDIGYGDDGYILPDLNEIIKSVPGEDMPEKINATTYHQCMKRSAAERVTAAAELASMIDGQVVIWCNTNDEADMLKKAIPEAVEVRGSHKPEYKEQAAVDFINNKYKILISKPTMFGYGLNFQNCHDTIFCGRDFSYENYYQATRRFWRFGQAHAVNVYTIIGEGERQIIENVQGKIELQDEMKNNMYTGLKQIQINSIAGHDFKLHINNEQITIPAWLRVGA